MRKSFNSLITIFLILSTIGCKSSYFLNNTNTENIATYSSAAPLDSQIVKMYLPYKEKLNEEMNEVISTSTTEMVKNRPESLLTNLLADILLYRAAIESEKLSLNIDSDVSFFNYGGIRSSLPKGKIKRKHIFQIMPFENELVLVELDGKNLELFFNQIAQSGGGSISGARFIIDKDNNTKNIQINGNPINYTKKYWLATNDYVANGGDNFRMLKNARKINLKIKIRDVLIEYMIAKRDNGELIETQLDGRISYE